MNEENTNRKINKKCFLSTRNFLNYYTLKLVKHYDTNQPIKDLPKNIQKWESFDPFSGRPSGEIDVAASACPVGSVKLLCKLKGHPDIVHMTVDKQLKVLAVVFRTLEKKVFRYDVEVIDVRMT